MGIINNDFGNAEIEEQTKNKKVKKEDLMKSSKTRTQKTIEGAWPIEQKDFTRICMMQRATSVNAVHSVHREIIEQIFWKIGEELPEGVKSFDLHFINFRDGSKNTLFIGVEDAQTPGILGIYMCSNIWNSSWKEVTDFMDMLRDEKASMQYIHQDDIGIDLNAWWNN